MLGLPHSVKMIASLSTSLASSYGLRSLSMSFSDKGKGQQVTNKETSLIAEQSHQTASSPVQFLLVKAAA